MWVRDNDLIVILGWNIPLSIVCQHTAPLKRMKSQWQLNWHFSCAFGHYKTNCHPFKGLVTLMNLWIGLQAIDTQIILTCRITRSVEMAIYASINLHYGVTQTRLTFCLPGSPPCRFVFVIPAYVNKGALLFCSALPQNLFRIRNLILPRALLALDQSAHLQISEQINTAVLQASALFTFCNLQRTSMLCSCHITGRIGGASRGARRRLHTCRSWQVCKAWQKEWALQGLST